MPVTEVTTTNEFNNYLTNTNSSNKYVLVDFYTTWCGPCKRFAPTLEKLSEKYQYVTFLKVDADKLDDVADRYNVSSLPTFIMFQVGHSTPLYPAVAGANENKVEAMLKMVTETVTQDDF